MSIARTVVINPIEPAMLSVRAPLGIEMVLDVTFLAQNGTPIDPATLMPQLIMLPRSQGGSYGYDFVPADGRFAGIVTVPGPAMSDLYGYSLEVYSRREADHPVNPPVPTGMLAKGTVALEGSAYTRIGPFAPIVIPTIVGPQGPQGEQGIPGVRGSIWTTGNGDPVATGDELDGDMYLNNLNGDVWRFDGTTSLWMLGHF